MRPTSRRAGREAPVDLVAAEADDRVGPAQGRHLAISLYPSKLVHECTVTPKANTVMPPAARERPGFRSSIPG